MIPYPLNDFEIQRHYQADLDLRAFINGLPDQRL